MEFVNQFPMLEKSLVLDIVHENPAAALEVLTQLAAEHQQPSPSPSPSSSTNSNSNSNSNNNSGTPAVTPVPFTPTTAVALTSPMSASTSTAIDTHADKAPVILQHLSNRGNHIRCLSSHDLVLLRREKCDYVLPNGNLLWVGFSNASTPSPSSLATLASPVNLVASQVQAPAATLSVLRIQNNTPSFVRTKLHDSERYAEGSIACC
jgi:hypothetical protein